MRYHIKGSLINREVGRYTHEEFVHLIQSKFAPSLRLLSSDTSHGKVIAGGVPAGGRDIILIVDLKNSESHAAVRNFLVSLPIFDHYEWEAIPLETFEEMEKRMQ
jgi:hypothetical protein